MVGGSIQPTNQMKLKVQDAHAGKHNEELNIACAELEGWKHSICRAVSLKGIDVEMWTLFGVSLFIGDLPNYVSPNAIEALGNVHRLEGLLNGMQVIHYVDQLMRIIGVFKASFALIHATALQRTVTLLLVLKPELFEAAS